MKGQGMMKSEDMKGMGSSMVNMSGMMGDMGRMMGSGKMTPEEMQNMSKMMGVVRHDEADVGADGRDGELKDTVEVTRSGLGAIPWNFLVSSLESNSENSGEEVCHET